MNVILGLLLELALSCVIDTLVPDGLPQEHFVVCEDLGIISSADLVFGIWKKN